MALLYQTPHDKESVMPE